MKNSSTKKTVKKSAGAQKAKAVSTAKCSGSQSKKSPKKPATKEGDLMDSLTPEQVSELVDNLCDKLRDELCDSLFDRLYDCLFGELHDSLRESLHDDLSDSLYDDLRGDLQAKLLEDQEDDES